MLKFSRNLTRIIDLAAFVAPIEQSQATVTQRFHETTQHALERAAGDDIFSLTVLNKASRLFGIWRDDARISNEERRLCIHIYFQLTRKKLLFPLTNQAMMPDGNATIRW